MGEKDITQKTLESFNDVFSDIVNVLLFDGKTVINEHELSEATEFSYYKATGEVRAQDRDIAKYWKNGTIQISMIGLENQTETDNNMPLRIISYDGAAYRDQIARDKNAENYYPIITMVLYFGYKHRWNRSRSLKERLTIPDEIAPYVNDYRVNLFEIAYLDDDTICKFKSDFKIVADYCSQMRRTGKYIHNKDTLVHPKEVMEAMSAFTGDREFEDGYNKYLESDEYEKGDEVTVDGIMTRTKKEGMEQATREIVMNAYGNGHSAQEISDFNSIPLDKVEAIISEPDNRTDE